MEGTPEWDLPPLGHVVVEGRGSLPFALLHGESLVAIASWALSEAGAELLDFNATWRSVQVLERPLVIHDALCPLTPVGFLREAADQAIRSGAVVVGVRPVTDTVKSASEEGVVGETVDRERLWAVTSPVVLPEAVVAALEDWPGTDDLAALVESLRDRFPVTFLEAPPLGRRVEDESAVRLLEAFDEDAG